MGVKPHRFFPKGIPSEKTYEVCNKLKINILYRFTPLSILAISLVFS